jgi:hypothetical protein
LTAMAKMEMLNRNGLVGTPGVIRTPDPLLRRQVLYPAELRAHITDYKQLTPE